MKKTTLRFAATAALCAPLLVSAPATAQRRAQAPVPHIDLGVSIDELYDTNVARTSDAGAAQRGLSQSDLRVTPAATIDLYRPIGRQSVSLTGSVGYDFYNRNTRLNRERIGLNGAFGYDLAGCRGAVTAAYARRQSDLGDLIFIPAPGDTARFRNVEDIKTLGANAQCGGPIGLMPTAGIVQTWADNSTGIRKFSDYDSTVVTGGVAYGRPSFGQLTLFSTYGRTRFPNRPLGNGSNDGFESGSIGLRFERQIGARLRGLAELSYSRVSPDRIGVQDFAGLTWAGELTADLGPRLSITGRTGRAVQASNRVDANYLLERSHSIDATYALGRQLTFNAGVLQRDRDYRSAGPKVVPAPR